MQVTFTLKRLLKDSLDDIEGYLLFIIQSRLQKSSAYLIACSKQNEKRH